MRLKVIDYDVMQVAFDEKFKHTYQLIQNGETHLDNLAEGFKEADGVIFALPTIEAEPVKHGRWKPYQTPIETRQSGWICTNCSGVQNDLSNGDTNYCPNCGAKMDGGDENED